MAAVWRVHEKGVAVLLARLDLRVESDVINDGESKPELWRTGWWD